MTWVAVGALLVAALAIASTGTIVRSLIRSQARERDALLDKIMHLAGRTWTPPPNPPAPEDPYQDFGLLDPAQLPEDY